MEKGERFIILALEYSKTGLTYFYTKIQWELAFVLIFIAGIGMGILISYYAA